MILVTAAVIATLAVPSTASALCAGDCGSRGTVTVDDVVSVVRILLGDESLDACAAADSDENGKVSVDDAVRAVRAVLEGCPYVCGNGVVEPGEECDVDLPFDTICYDDCTLCCSGDDCVEDRCCWRDRVDGLVPLDPSCRSCGELGEGCGQTQFSSWGCCDDVACWELVPDDPSLPRAVTGRCCPPPGSSCQSDADCCGVSWAVWLTPGDACVDGSCCVQSGGVCRTDFRSRGPCCNPEEQCTGPMALEGSNFCCKRGEDGTCCADRGEPCWVRDFAHTTRKASCCRADDLCEKVVDPSVTPSTTVCCGAVGASCASHEECCSDFCTPEGACAPALGLDTLP